MIETAVKERPIIFSAPMIQAILDDRKSQTRRIIKPQPLKAAVHGWWLDFDTPREKHFSFDDDVTEHIFHEFNCPYGNVYGDGSADRLWVRETFAIENNYEYRNYCGEMPTDGRPVKTIESADGDYDLIPHYRATDPDPHIVPFDSPVEYDDRTRWTPSIFMPRWASRITLEITDIRVERVAVISAEDCVAEGIVPDTETHAGQYWREDAVNQFRELWDSINAARGYDFDSNRWVWVIEFRRLTP